jgi:3D (Asp-Asp-Asp) domain-containing protein
VKVKRLIAAAVTVLLALPVIVLVAAVGVITDADQAACQTPPAGAGFASGGSWIATAYGPPWDAMNGSGITATGLDLTAGPPAYEIAVDPGVIPLRSFAHVQPNPFGTARAFYAGDTGGAIVGEHVDIYDWRGRADQDAWGVRHVTVTPAPNPGTGDLLEEIAPSPVPAGNSSDAPGVSAGTSWSPACDQLVFTVTLQLTPGEQARILPDGSAAAPADAPAAVKLTIAAANEIHTKPYPDPVAHFGSLAYPWPAYDCSGAVSYVLYRAGLHGQWPDGSGTLESRGAPGPGRWISVYANSAHAWIVVAGLAFDTADYGGPNIPAGTGPRWRQNPLGNLADGLSYVVRHPPGL